MNTGDLFPELLVAQGRVLHYQRKLHAWADTAPRDMPMERRMPWKPHLGAEGDREETTGPKADTGASPSTLPGLRVCRSRRCVRNVRRWGPTARASGGG